MQLWPPKKGVVADEKYKSHVMSETEATLTKNQTSSYISLLKVAYSRKNRFLIFDRVVKNLFTVHSRVGSIFVRDSTVRQSLTDHSPSFLDLLVLIVPIELFLMLSCF